MKIVRVIKKKDSKKVDNVDPKAMVSDWNTVLKEAKDCKKKIDKILDSGNYFQLVEAKGIFDRVLVMAEELRKEYEMALHEWWNYGRDKELGKAFEKMNPNPIKLHAIIFNMNEQLSQTIPVIQTLRNSLKEFRKMNFL